MAIVSSDIREVMFDDQTIVKFQADETTDQVVAKLEDAGYVVNVF